MKQNFEDLIDNLKKSIADYKYYVDFDKVYKNVDKLKYELNNLNVLIGSVDIENEFRTLISKYPETLKALPILLAVRNSEIAFVDEYEFTIKFDNSESIDTYVKFMKETGLFNLLGDKKIKSVMDYVTGVEVGLDSNARKNRTGKTMENIVENFIKKVPNVEYHSQMKKEAILLKYGIDIDELISNNPDVKNATKIFDFVVKTEDKLFLIETNFYGSGGSKLNETARSYKSITNDLKDVQNVYFVWITDGVGWTTAKRNLEETFEVLEHLYTLTDLENGVLNTVLK